MQVLRRSVPLDQREGEANRKEEADQADAKTHRKQRRRVLQDGAVDLPAAAPEEQKDHAARQQNTLQARHLGRETALLQVV